ncbi:MAG TPA: hypothetical protein VIS71_01680 [Terrimicrobium sp.]
MDEAPTTVIIQRHLDALPGDTAAEPIVREPLKQAAGRLCTTLLYKSYPRLTRPPVNLETDELLGGIVSRAAHGPADDPPPTVRRFFALANQHMRWQLNDLARRLDERASPRTSGRSSTWSAFRGCSTARPLISFEDVESPFPPRNQTWKQTFWTGTREPNSYPYP